MSNLLHLLDDEAEETFDPLSTPNFLWWFDDTDATVDGTDSAKVGEIPSKLGGGIIKGFTGTASKPLINTRTFNGRGVVEFVSASSHYIDTNLPNFTNLGDYTVITFIDWDNYTDDPNFPFAGHQGGSANFAIRAATFGTVVQLGFGNPTTGVTLGASSAGPQIIVHRREGTLLEGWKNGTDYATNGTGANVDMGNGFLFGRENAAGGRNYFDGAVPEQRGFQRALTRDEINDHCNDIKAIWGPSVPWTNI